MRPASLRPPSHGIRLLYSGINVILFTTEDDILLKWHFFLSKCPVLTNFPEKTM